MAVTLNASASAGLITTADTSTILQLQTGGTTALTVDASQNVGIGVTPSAWKSNYKAVQVGNAAAVVGRTDNNNNYFSSNWFVNSSNQDIYQNTGFATIYSQGTGTHAWYTAASGTAGNTISFTQAMTLASTGQLMLGTTSTDSALSVDIQNVSASSNNVLVQIKNVFSGEDTGLIINGNNGGQRDYRIGVNTVDNTPDLTFSGPTGFRWYVGGTERARITAAGDFLVGKNTAAVSSGGNGLYVAANGFVGTNIPSSLADTFNVFNSTAAVYRFYVTQGGTIFATSTTISAISDQRLKENVQDLDVGLDAVMALKPRKFDWKEGKGKDIKGDRGWIAQEVEQVFPDMIDDWKDESPEGEDPYKSVRADLIPVLVKAIQEQQAIIQTLTDRITVLEGTTP